MRPLTLENEKLTVTGHYTKVFMWEDGTVCFEDDIEAFMSFMPDDFNEMLFTNNELLQHGLL